MKQTPEQTAAKATSKAANNTKGQVTDTVNSATKSVHSAIDAASDAVAPAVDSVRRSAHTATDKTSAAAIDVAENIEKRGEQFGAAQMRFSESCRAHVRENPIASLGIAVAAGFALNWWLSRPSRRD